MSKNDDMRPWLTGAEEWHCPICLTESSHVHKCMLCGRAEAIGAAAEGRLVPCSRCPRSFHFSCLERGPAAAVESPHARGAWDEHGAGGQMN